MLMLQNRVTMYLKIIFQAPVGFTDDECTFFFLAVIICFFYFEMFHYYCLYCLFSYVQIN